MPQFEAIVYHVAASHIDKELLARIMRSFMKGDDYDEELKLDTANAMSKGELGMEGADSREGGGTVRRARRPVPSTR